MKWRHGFTQAFLIFAPRDYRIILNLENKEGTEEATAKVNRIHKKLFDYVIEALKAKHGVDDKAWWIQGSACENSAGLFQQMGRGGS